VTNNIIGFPGATTLDIDPDNVLSANIGQYKAVVLIGYNHDDEECFASSVGDLAECLWLAEKFKQFILSEEMDSD